MLSKQFRFRAILKISLISSNTFDRYALRSGLASTAHSRTKLSYVSKGIPWRVRAVSQSLRLKTFLIILAGITGVFALTEIGLRNIMGFGTPLYIAELNQLGESTGENDRLSQNLAAIPEIKAIADAANTEFILV